ncbi:MAG TPA: hypothetical protein DEH78_04765, partial [Solibacterales bacterium]|nr:hypothetical protein [Bryobacterales bacterium]
MQKLCALCLLLLAATSTFAQIRSAVVIGAVTDPSGAAVPNAVIKLTNEETNVVSETKTNEAGLFTVPYLPAGRYSLDVAASGFNSYRQTGIVVSTAQTARSDVSLKVGAVETRVDVAASALQLQTESTSLGGSISENLIKNVPNMTQNPLFYATLQAGIVGRPQMMETQRADSFGIGQSSRQRFSAVNVNGANAFTNDIQLDGVSTQGSAWNEMTVLPNSEGIQEVRVTTNNFSAEYGRGQGIISFTTKSGTNEYHGSGFWRVRNEALNANTFSNNALGIPRAPFKPHNYGGTFGGPIKKNSLFFFVSWEGLRHRDAADWLLTVPTERERRGDFSQTFIRDQNGNPVRVGVFDPFNATQQGPDLWRRQPIPNSVIPNPDRGALHLFSFYPNPNRPAVDPVTGAQNFFQRNIRPFERNNINSRVDWRAGKHSIYGTAGTQRGSINAGRPFGADNPFYQPPSNGWTAQLNDDNNPYAAIGDTVVLSPTLLLDVRYGINRIASNSISPTPQPFDYGPLGIPSAYLPVMPLPGSAPDFGPGGNLSDLGNQSYQSKRERQTNHHIAGSMTKNLNRWTFKFGSEYRVMLSNYTDFQEAAFRINAPGWGGPGSYSSEFVTANGSGSPLNANPGQFGYDPANLFMGGGSINIAPGFPVRPAFAQKYFAL